MSDGMATYEYVFIAVSGFIKAFLFVVIGYLIFSLGRAYEQVKSEKALVASGRCEYRADAKTGVTRLVWVDTGEPVEKGE